MDDDQNIRYLWGNQSRDGKKIQGIWGWENGEPEDNFKLTLYVG